jgi:predicted nucleic acid-binding protein
MGETVYLDTSVMVKRCVDEPGGEFDKAYTIGRISGEARVAAGRRILNELNRLTGLGALTTIHLRASMLRDAWKLVREASCLPCGRAADNLREICNR